jgi:hypothetical protein
MNPRRIFRGFKFFAFALAAALALGFAVMALWNFVIPPLTGWHPLTFVQALALFVLCRLLLGGFRGRHRRHGMHARWQQLSPQERDRLRQRFGRCGSRSGSDAPPATPAGP